jgi:ankyrin repeat protein
VIKALIAAYPEAIRSGCEEGFLPLHRYLYRPLVDLDALRLLINYFPDALMARSARGQTPLHVALDHHSPDALAVELLLELCPAAVSVADSDRYLPLHLCLDCAEVSVQSLCFLSQSLGLFIFSDCLKKSMAIFGHTELTPFSISVSSFRCAHRSPTTRWRRSC